MRRRLLMFFLVALATAMSATAWLYDGDLEAAVSPLVKQSLSSPIALPEEPLVAAPADPPADDE